MNGIKAKVLVTLAPINVNRNGNMWMHMFSSLVLSLALQFVFILAVCVLVCECVKLSLFSIRMKIINSNNNNSIFTEKWVTNYFHFFLNKFNLKSMDIPRDWTDGYRFSRQMKDCSRNSHIKCVAEWYFSAEWPLPWTRYCMPLKSDLEKNGDGNHRLASLV